MRPLTPIAIANIKHSLPPGQINIKLHSKSLFASVFSQYIMLGFPQTITGHTKRQEQTQAWREKASEPDSIMILELIR